MYPANDLDAPPPPSRFRRPWSPDPLNPLPSISRPAHDHSYDYLFASHRARQQEPSDASVEALDLADYAVALARTTQVPPSTGRERVIFRPHDPYPPSPPPLRPLASDAPISSPSLVTPSSTGSPTFSDSDPRTPTHRPFSLPRSLQSHSSLSAYAPAHVRREPQVRVVSSSPSEADLSQFLSPPVSAYERGFSNKLFDPTFPAHAYADFGASRQTFSPPPSYPSHPSLDRDIVPWSSGTDYDVPVNPELKEERMRMLEAKFAKVQPQKDEDKPKVGSVDEKGDIVTDGPFKRLAVRCVEFLLMVAACVSSVYTALIIKPSSTPPPAEKLPAYVLYSFSFISIIAFIFLFVFYPCCCGRRKAAPKNQLSGPGGMMVLPVQGLPGAEKGRKKKKGGGPGDNGVQVNLIVDPTIFGRDQDRDEEWDDEDGEEDNSELGGVPGTYESSARRGKRRRPRRQGIFAGLAMEALWKHARKQLKIRTTFDVVVCLLWGVVFVVILMGKRCAVGAYDGWCDGYNVGTAAACLLCVAFIFSIYFDIKDLHASKASPRTRP